MPQPTTLPQLLRLRSSSSEFLLTDDGPVTYADLDALSDRLATGFRALGLGAGDRIALAAPNGVPWIATWFAAGKIGAIVVTLNVVYRESEFIYMLNQSQARAVVCVDEFGGFDFVPFLGTVLEQVPSVEHTIFLGGAWEALAQTPADPAALQHTVAPTDPSVILYTSGTTGQPKGAVLTHRSILASAYGEVDRFGLTEHDVFIGHMPLTHVGGMTCSLISALAAGAKYSVVTSFHPAKALEIVERDKVTVFPGVPTMFKMVISLAESTAADLSSVRICVPGGSNVEPALAKRIDEAFGGVRIANLYGLSECSGACIISAETDDLQTITDTIGVPLLGVEARIIDAAGNVLAPGEVGELQINGDSLAAGYWELPEQSAATFSADGWLSTGDIALMTGDGHVALRGRLKEMYVRGGYNVYPAEIENLLATHPSVAMSAIVGAPDDKWGEIGHAFVVPRPGETVDIDALRTLCLDQLAQYKVPDRFTIVDELPLTPAGKIRKVDLKARAASL